METARKYCRERLHMEDVVLEVANYLFTQCKVVAGHEEVGDVTPYPIKRRLSGGEFPGAQRRGLRSARATSPGQRRVPHPPDDVSHGGGEGGAGGSGPATAGGADPRQRPRQAVRPDARHAAPPGAAGGQAGHVGADHA